ncbi:MAG: hypothetical protein ABJN04_02100 [Hyphomicrobiales bacterium]
MRKTTLVLATTLIAGLASQMPAFAGGYGGGSALGQNPELFITIAERQQIIKLYREKGIKPFPGDANQKLGVEAIEWQIRYQDRQAARKQGRKLGYRTKSRK